jgi:predicted nicotinamide N-methyase
MRPPHATVLGVPVSVRHHPLVPEIPLHLADDGISLRDYVRVIQEAEHIPCWAFAWAAGALLARTLLDQPERVRGKVVVDFGAGSGIVAIAAALAGASTVYAVDRDPDSLEAMRANLALSPLPVLVTNDMPERYDVLCAADVLYASDNARLLAGFARPGTVLLLADAYRDGAPLGLEVDLRCQVRTFPDVDAPVHHATLTVVDSEHRRRALLEYASQNREP